MTVTTKTEYFVTDVGWRYSLGIPVYLAIEVLSLTPDQVCPLPSPHPGLLGVMGWRGQLLWLVALDSWLGLSPQPTLPGGPSARPVVVLQDSNLGRSLACVVHRLNRIEAIAPSCLEALPPDLPSELVPYFRGQVAPSNLLVFNDYCLFQPETWRIIRHGQTV